MKYGKIIDGILHIYGGPGEGRKSIQDSVPEGYDKSQCQMLPGGYKDLGDTIGVEYEYVVPGQSLTDQRITDLEERLELAEGAVQEIIIEEGEV